MNTNREAVLNLISLLVKKSGFDLNRTDAEDEINKIRDSIIRLKKDKEYSGDRKNTQKLIENLKSKQAFWENSAQSIGKYLVNAYDEGKSYEQVKSKIEELFLAAKNGTDELQVNYIYSRISELEEELNKLNEEINNSDYVNYEEREMDVKFKAYLENKINSINAEIDDNKKELESLQEVETKDTSIREKIKEYTDNLSKNYKTLENITKKSMNTMVSLEVWEKLENSRNDIEEKLNKSQELLEKTENNLSDVRKRINELSSLEKSLLDEIDRCNLKLKNTTSKLETDDYINNAKKMLDISKCEMIKIEIDTLKNKKNVIYVDADKVKQELTREWDVGEKIPIVKGHAKKIIGIDKPIEEKKENKIIEEKPQIIVEETKEVEMPKEEVIIPDISKEEPVKIEVHEDNATKKLVIPVIEEKKEEEITTEIKKNKYELDW